MKALQLESPGQLRFLEVPDPCASPNLDEVILDVTHCALCRTDAKMYHEGHRDLTLPRVLGHEFCGTLEGEADSFVVWPGVACGTCDHCAGGRENLCPSMRIIGFHRDGGLAERVLVPRGCLLRVPDSLRPDLAVLAEPLGCVFNAFHQVKIREGDRVLIYGAGPLGLMMSLVVQAFNAEAWVVEKSSTRTSKIKPFCRSTGLEVTATPPRETFQVAINAAASLDAVTDGVSRVKAGGCFCLFSGLPAAEAVPANLLNEIHYRQLNLVGAYGCTRRNMADALELLASHSKTLELLIEGLIGLEGVREILPALLRSELLKIVVRIRS